MIKKAIALFFFVAVAGRLSSVIEFIFPDISLIPDRVITKVVWIPVLLPILAYIFFYNRQALLTFFKKNRDIIVSLLLFILSALISTIFAFSPVESALTFGYYLLLISIFFLPILLSKRDGDYIFNVIGGSVIILFIVGAIQYLDFYYNQNHGLVSEFFRNGGFVPIEFFNIRTENSGIFLRPSSLMVDPNIFGGFLAISSVFSLHFLKSRRMVLFSSVVLFVSLLSLLLTASRTGILALVVGCFVYLAYNFKISGRVFSLFGVGELLRSVVSRIVDGLSLSDSSSAYHLEFAKGAIQMFRDRPLFGVGVGGYPLYFKGVINSAVTFGTAHSAYLRVLSETGALGLISFAWLIISFLRRLLAWKSPLLMAVFFSVLAGNIFYDYFMTPWVWFLLGVMFSDIEF